MNVNSTQLSEQQLEDQLQSIVRFLKSVHPTLTKDDGFRPGVELRPIPRDEKTYMLYKSLTIWDFGTESIGRLRKFLERHNGAKTCLYYSIFTYDNNKKTLTGRGTPAKAGKITSESALFAEEIALDFDGIGFMEYIELADQFESLGISAIWVSTGHGYHAHILLKESLSDKRFLRRVVYKFRSKGMFCDSACVDPARVMRLPWTFNNKCFADDDYADERSNPPMCSVLQETDKRYDLEDVLNKLDKLPTVSKEDEDAYLAVEALFLSEEKKTEELSVSSAEPSDDIMVRRIEYKYLSEHTLPDAVTKILAHTPKGYRNPALGFLIRFFKDQYKMGIKAIFETLELWSREACDPAYEPGEFESDFARLYKHGGLGYDGELAKKYGSIDFQGLIHLRKQDIHIPHSFFRSFVELDGKEVRTYLAIKLLEHFDDETTQEKIAETLGISVRALRPSIQSLTKSKHCYMKKGNATKKIPNTYHTNKINSIHDGYMVFGYDSIRAWLIELCEQGSRTRSTGELKLYLYMRWKFYTGDIYMSQQNLGKNIGAEQNSISVMAYRLQEKHFLKIQKMHYRGNVESCEYTLLR